MIPLIQNIQQKHQLKKTLFAFLAEMEKNLETFYVIDQRQFITYGFSMGAWADVKELSYIKKHESISVYARALEEFNALYKAHKEFEQWYSTDLERKTTDNAKKLHGMKNELDNKLKGIESIIILAGQALEKEMLELGLLKA